MKLAALGVTIVVSSGDNGAAGRVQNCNANSGSLVSPLWLVSHVFVHKFFFADALCWSILKLL